MYGGQVWSLGALTNNASIEYLYKHTGVCILYIRQQNIHTWVCILYITVSVSSYACIYTWTALRVECEGLRPSIYCMYVCMYVCMWTRTALKGKCEKGNFSAITDLILKSIAFFNPEGYLISLLPESSAPTLLLVAAGVTIRQIEFTK